MPALLRAGPSPSSRALERLEIGGVVQVLQPEVECEGRRWLQVAGNLYGRGWCSLETANEQPILRPLPARRPTAKPHRECDQLTLPARQTDRDKDRQRQAHTHTRAHTHTHTHTILTLTLTLTLSLSLSLSLSFSLSLSLGRDQKAR
jgi:hypothetical protein